MKKRHIVIVLVACCVPLIVKGQAPGDLAQAARARDLAIDKVDVTTWERLTAPDFTVVNETGRLLTRTERIAEFKKMKPAASPSTCGQERIVMFASGNAATRRCLSEGNWWIEVWAKSGSGWQAVAVQGTRAAK